MKDIKVNIPCKVQKFELDIKLKKNKNSIEIIEGEFIKIYKHFYMFRTKGGHRECFTKRTFNIDWGVLKN